VKLEKCLALIGNRRTQIAHEKSIQVGVQ